MRKLTLERSAMSELTDEMYGSNSCYWTGDLCWHLELDDCTECPEKDTASKVIGNSREGIREE